MRDGEAAPAHRRRPVVGRRVEEINLPKGVTIGAIVRQRSGAVTKRGSDWGTVGGDAQVLIAHHDTVIESDDHVIVFAVNKSTVPKVEKLFQVSAGFL